MSNESNVFYQTYYLFVSGTGFIMTANVRVYDQLREPGHFCIELQLLLLIGQGQPYSLKTKLYMRAQAETAIGYTRC